MTETIFAIEQVGRLGNHMLQYMFARAVQHYARRPVRIVGADMPVWGVSARDPAPDAAAPRIGGHLLSARWIASAIDRHAPPRLRMNNLCFRVGNFLPASGYAQDFPLLEGEGRTPPADALLIHVRAGDIVSDVHPNYGPLPFSYYRHVIQDTGLAPIFIGELKTEPYASALRSAFPEAEFWDDGSPIEDFQTMRRAKHLAISVSTFGWLAAFFSQADRIHMPIAGFLDPLDRPDMDTLPLGDARITYRRVPEDVWRTRFSDFDGTGAIFAPCDGPWLQRRRTQAAQRVAAGRLTAQAGFELRCARSRFLPTRAA